MVLTGDSFWCLTINPLYEADSDVWLFVREVLIQLCGNFWGYLVVLLYWITSKGISNNEMLIHFLVRS